MTAEPAPNERPLRRDAERNRQRILDAARVVFAERGLRGSHDDIAREAGVGVGTVYRRFPDKEQLIDALFEEQLRRIAGARRRGARRARTTLGGAGRLPRAGARSFRPRTAACASCCSAPPPGTSSRSARGRCCARWWPSWFARAQESGELRADIATPTCR